MVAAKMKEERRDRPTVELRSEYGIASDNFRTLQILTNRLVNISHSLFTRELPVYTPTKHFVRAKRLIVCFLKASHIVYRGR